LFKDQPLTTERVIHPLDTSDSGIGTLAEERPGNSQKRETAPYYRTYKILVTNN